VVEDEREPWWASNSQLIEIRRRTLEEFDRELEQREPKAGCSGSLCPGLVACPSFALPAQVGIKTSCITCLLWRGPPPPDPRRVA
jgi:hypothetical protein